MKTNPITGVTDGQLRAQIRSALREVWRNSSRRKFLESVRVPHEGAGRAKYDVLCNICGKRMGFSEKAIFMKADGTPRKKKTLVYQVDHLETNAPFLDLERDLGAYAKSLIFGEMQIACYECHSDITSQQRKK
jgi:hypothetical protein